MERGAEPIQDAVSIDTTGLEQRRRRMLGALPALLKNAAQRVPFQFQVLVEKHFERGSLPKGVRSTSSRLHVNTGRLARSIVPQQEGNLTEITATSTGITVQVGSRVLTSRGFNYGRYHDLDAPKLRPWFTPAVEEMRTTHADRIAQSILAAVLKEWNQ
jgi:hypothetical protein